MNNDREISRVVLSTALVLVGTGCAEIEPSGPAARQEERALQDQNGKRWPLGGVLEGPAVLILGDRTASESSTRWDNDVVAPLLVRYALEAHRILDLSDVSRIFEPLVARKLSASVSPPGTPILLDWSGELRRRFQSESGVTTIILLSHEGQEVLRVTGPPGAGKERLLLEAVDDLCGSDGESSRVRSGDSRDAFTSGIAGSGTLPACREKPRLDPSLPGLYRTSSLP